MTKMEKIYYLLVTNANNIIIANRRYAANRLFIDHINGEDFGTSSAEQQRATAVINQLYKEAIENEKNK